jgi:biotin synthase
MKTATENILSKSLLTREDLIHLLSTKEEKEKFALYRKAYQVKKEHCGNVVYLRGLIEYSNICRKDCHYCGIRKSNEKVERYTLNSEEVLDRAMMAWRRDFGSIVIQTGERTDKVFIDGLTKLIREIRERTEGTLGITLSCGEQSPETYRQWFDAGAHRYLLRIETTSEELFRKIHPDNEFHRYEDRLLALENLRKTGFQTGTGVMIGLPGQTFENLADDLMFFRSFDIDMIGMGPYIPHPEAPMAAWKTKLLKPAERLELSLRMIALARILLKDVNIAASTALQALDPDGRIKAILAGANVYMPNMTPKIYADNYNLYEGKPAVRDNAMEIVKELELRLKGLGEVIGYGKWGDSKHFFKRKTSPPSPPSDRSTSPPSPLSDHSTSPPGPLSILERGSEGEVKKLSYETR